MDSGILILLGAAFAASTTLLLLLNQKRREIILNRIPLRRRVSGAATPPRSLSPKKEQLDPTKFDYTDVLPPSRRHTLNEVAPHIVAQFPRPDGGLEKTIHAPMDVPFDQWNPKALTPCEFSKDDVVALGDFPDYAALSGVPLPEAYEGFDIKTAKSRPYRPFRWAYHQTMSLTKMERDWWLEVDAEYEDRIMQRKGLFEKHGKSVLDYLPGSELACKELMEMILQFLGARYPQHFSLDVKNMKFHNRILNQVTDLKATPPLRVILDNCPEDFAIMLRNPETGFYCFRAGVICSALGWNLGTKIGMQLDAIHKPIPDYKEKMQFSMDRYFAKKPTDKCIQRGSWGLEVDKPLYMPPGDPHEEYRTMQAPTLSESQCHLRVDWQTLRRLPLSGAIVFNFKALFSPVTEFRHEPYIPSLILKVVKDGKKSIMEYKNTWHTEHVVLPMLEEYKREQIEKGLVPKDWEEHTLEESPFFPGWEEKWHGDQGF